MNKPIDVPKAVAGADPEKLYETMTADRQPYLDRGRLCASLTIPFLLPPDGTDKGTKLPTPHQAIGAQGVNNLANQLLSSLFPPNSPFFRLMVDDATVTEIGQDEKARSRVEEKLNEIERIIHLRFGYRLPRAVLLFVLKQLIVSGNSLLVLRKDSVRAHRLDQFVVRRDGSGNLLHAIVREEVAIAALPENLSEFLKTLEQEPKDPSVREGNVAVMTYYKREGSVIKSYQTVKGFLVEGSEGKWPVEKAPIMALRWSWQDGEDYGRSYVEEYLGDLQAAEGLSKAIRETAAAAAKVVILVNPNGLTQEDDVSDAENLEVITGKVEDVQILQLNKAADMQVAKAVLDEIVMRLSQAFLMFLGVRRNAERVTANETRQVVAALENALGGTYALFAQEMQLPLVRIIMAELESDGRIPKLPISDKKPGVVEPIITTGVEALGRGEDFARYNTFVTSILHVLPPEIALKYLNVPDFIKRAGTSLNIDMDGLIKSSDDIAREEEQARALEQQRLAERTLAGAAEKAAGPAAQAMIAQQGQQNA